MKFIDKMSQSPNPLNNKVLQSISLLFGKMGLSVNKDLTSPVVISSTKYLFWCFAEFEYSVNLGQDAASSDINIVLMNLTL